MRPARDKKKFHAGKNFGTAPARSRRAEAIAICFILIGLVWIVFGQTLRAGFVNYDDDTYVYENPAVAAGITRAGIVWAFTHFYSSNWHPLTWLSHMLDCQLYGLNPGGHHFTNVLLHTAAVIVLFLGLREMTGASWRSGLVAALFAIHPLRAESVAWIAERKDVLSGLFFMLALVAYVRFTRIRSAPRYAALLLFFALGLMSKPMLVTLPFLLLLLDYWPLGRYHRKSVFRLILEKLPLFALAAASGIVTLLAQKTATASIERLPFSYRIENAVVSCVTYIRETIWPTGLAPFYPHPSNRLAPAEIALAGLMIVSITLAAVILRKTRPYIFTGWFWYLGMLGPVVGIIQVGMQAHADRYTYLPQIGLSILAVWTLADFSRSHDLLRQISNVGAVIVILALTCSAYIQTGYWRDSETLWNHTLAVTKDNDIAHNGLGDLFFGRGEIDKAVSEFRTALYLRPTSPYAHNNLGVALTKNGQIDEAIDHLQTAIRILPNHRTAHYNLGNAFLQKGEVDAAIGQFEQELALQPEHVNARCNLATSLLRKGEVDAAIAQYKNTIQLEPGYGEAHYNLGNCYFEKGDTKEALSEYRQALKASPRFTKARNNLGIVLEQSGKSDQAISQWEEVIRVDPGNIDALNNLGWVLATSTNRSIRDGAKALRYAHRLKELLPDPDARILRTIAAAYAENGRFNEAVETAGQGLQRASRQGNQSLATALQKDLELYRNRTAIGDPNRMNPLSLP